MIQHKMDMVHSDALGLSLLFLEKGLRMRPLIRGMSLLISNNLLLLLLSIINGS